MPIISTLQINTIRPSPQSFSQIATPYSLSDIYKLYSLHRYASFQINALYPLHRNTHYILYSEMHIISSPQLNTLYSLHRHAHYMLFQEITLYLFHRNIHILFFDIHNKPFSADKDNMSLSKIFAVYYLLRHNLLVDTQVIFSSQK
jgi:hypothetical protein